MVEKLHLEDCLDDNPQLRAMVSVFEKDAHMLKKFSKAFSSSCQKVLNSQVMMISATQELSYYLRLYGQQNFPLDSSVSPTSSKEDLNENSLASTLNQFANHIDEISSCFQVLVTQLNDAMIYPLNKLVENEFDELTSLSQMYQISSEEDEQARQKYLKISNRKEYDQQRNQANEEVYVFRKKFHQSSLNYFSFLNSLQLKRKYMFIEPMLSFVHSLKLFFKMGTETFSAEASSKIDEFLNMTSSKVCETKSNLSEEINKTNQLIDLMQQDDSIYFAEQPDDQTDKDDSSTLNKNVLQKSGYLNLRSKFPFISKWDRAFYFIQNGYLMHQQKTDIVGSAFLELKSDLTVAPCEIDERQFTFQVSSQFPKKTFYFQANNKRDRDEWIKILENAIKADNQAKIQSHMNNLKLNNQGLDLRPSNSELSKRSNRDPNIKFELSDELSKKSNDQKLSKSEQGDTFKVRFLGSMNVNSDKGNEYINETIRQVMASRAEQNVFKLSEFNMVINSDSISLFKIPEHKIENDETISSKINYNELFKAEFNLNDIGFWSTHRENERLFGFISKDRSQSLKFLCHVFESDVNSNLICDSITCATQLAFKLLVENNKSDHLKLIKEREREILLQNIQNLPDKFDNEDDKNDEIEEDRYELINAAQLAFSSPNPNFIVLDREMLENFESTSVKLDNEQSINGQKIENVVKNSESDA